MKKITLKTPIVRGDEEITEITVREPQGGELRGVALSDFATLDTGAVLKILPRVTQPALTEAEGESMGVYDLVMIGTAMMGLNEDKAGNGTTPKP